MSSGYYGRLAILEVMAVDDAIRSMCTRAAPSTEIADYAKRRGDLTMKAFGEQLVSAGKTTREELLRVLD
jgi:type II secretory ATPase GspE/PulE/Tfp pilus assembly ATPase PilB-like protein